MIVVPLVFSSLVLGVLELGDVRKLGRIGGKTLAYTLFASGISVAIGITLVNVFRPGAGVDPSVRAELSSHLRRGLEGRDRERPEGPVLGGHACSP